MADVLAKAIKDAALKDTQGELFKTQADARKTAADTTAAKTGQDAWAATGGSRSELRMSMQLLAASNPALYGQLRSDELKAIKDSVNSSYTAQLNLYLQAGEDLKTAERHALEAANRIKTVNMNAFHMKFPDSDLGKYIGSTAKEANAYMEPLSAGARKKRTYRKKK